MNVGARTERAGRELIPTKRPTARERALYFLGAPVLGLIVSALTWMLEWSKARMLLVGLIAGSVYVLVATPLLLARRADR